MTGDSPLSPSWNGCSRHRNAAIDLPCAVGNSKQRKPCWSRQCSLLLQSWAQSQARMTRRLALHVAGLTRAWLLLGTIAVASTAVAQRRPSLCDPGATRIEATVLAVSQYTGCGHFGLAEAVIRMRVDRRISGPKTSRVVLAVVPCPGTNLHSVPRLEMCLGQQPPAEAHFYERYDDFGADPASRRYARILREY